MAGEWLKMECATPDKPEVLAITVKLGWDDPDLTVGKLFRLWRWFDQQTTDGNARGVTSALLDRQIGAPGFVQALADVGWALIGADGVVLVNFDRHNGKTAKDRALTAKRVANHKTNAGANGEANGIGNAEANGASVSDALPRKEKKRIKNPSGSTPPSKSARSSGARRVPADFAVTDDMREWAVEKAPLVNLQRETEKFRDWEFQHARSDWPATWRTWMHKAQESAEKGGTVGQRIATSRASDWTETAA